MKKKRFEYAVADLFCGAGGTSSGMIEALKILGYDPKLTGVNHNPIAIATSSLNHPDGRHLCTGVDDVDPRTLYRPWELQVMWASPECTHHSVARGGRPMNDQSRATAMCVIRWAEALLPPVILVENVKEFRDWGPIGTNGRPLKSMKGKTFQAWLGMLKSLGYRVDHRIFCAADYGDPTTRERLIVQAVRGQRRIVWPDRTHASTDEIFRMQQQGDLFGLPDLLPWVAAREIIDWSLEGVSIFERKKPLSEKTMRRIMEGLRRFGLKDFVVAWDHTGGSGKCSWPVTVPVTTITSKQRHGLVKPFLVPNFGEREGQNPRTHDIDLPAPAVTSHGAGALIEPMLVTLRGSQDSNINASAKPVSEPAPTVAANGTHIGLASAYLVNMKGKSNAADVHRPAPTITSHAPHLGIAKPFLVPTCHGGGESRALSIEATFPTVCGNRGDIAVCEPSLLPQQSGGAVRPVSDPAPTVATAGAIGLIEPCLVKYNGTGGAKPVSEPCDTITTRDRFGLVRPIVTVNGERYELDIRFRMLQPHELAAAQGFPKGYKFTGNKTEQVKQIGNAVPCGLARAVVLAAVSQRSDIAALMRENQAELAAA